MLNVGDVVKFRINAMADQLNWTDKPEFIIIKSIEIVEGGFDMATINGSYEHIDNYISSEVLILHLKLDIIKNRTHIINSLID